ncbi:tetratricopeptide repeat protein [Histoplasma capsulatum var. duboisii H88]|uniref:Tetratricopeptide repeat domain-containing protein n=1 Tax=Ajellomyces capsulatus (strain H88) TaxID=544711 RepID=F0UIA3_AJEC8|nr:tetratricopeptide repeat protein [Histoplasma capsulatum var. duboisii H88]QSS56976.1 tetratricopeptide repeat domain-containing protein [Histoplasma capsulatum var. duboisii H88]
MAEATPDSSSLIRELQTTTPPPESKQAQLADLIERASAKDAIKDYDAAAELYSRATELQAELNGEMSVENADLLYSYGKSLYNLAVRKSDVLGSKVSGQASNPPRNMTGDPAPRSEIGQPNESIIARAIAEGSTVDEKATRSIADNAKPQSSSLFQFTGDEDFDSGSDEENDGDAGDGAQQEEQEDEFANAFEMLDLSRILLLRKLENLESEKQDEERSVKERLADIYDLQAEICLEAERFEDAVTDLRASLELKTELFPLEDASIAECHYKLSLALEFSSITPEKEENGQGTTGEQVTKVDKEKRNEAANHMETAIRSCKLRISKELQKLENMEEDTVNKIKSNIEDVKEIVSDMEQRLIELRRPPVSISDRNDGFSDSNALNGILSQVLSQSSDTDKATMLQEAMKGANDLSLLVRKKKRTPTMAETSDEVESSGKRQLKPEAGTADEPSPGKRVRLDHGSSDE